MKYTFLYVLILFASCRQQFLETGPAIQLIDREFIEAKFGPQPLLSLNRAELDFTNVTKIISTEGHTIYMISFKDDAEKIYAISDVTKQEILYTKRMVDDMNGIVEIDKDGEKVIIEFKDGVRTVNNMLQSLSSYHGGPGFCQREANEKFSDCYKKESDEFCDSFISCIAKDTQPSIAIVIALSCSCKAKIKETKGPVTISGDSTIAKPFIKKQTLPIILSDTLNP